jgi:hypothetical protein
MQINSGIFRLVDLSPGWLYDQSGSRMMWRDVTEAVEAEDERASGVGQGVHPPAGGGGAQSVVVGLPDAGLAGELGRAASAMRRSRATAARRGRTR